MGETATSTVPIVKIRPARGLRPLDFRELWSYRELLYFLAWRDVKIRYKQTAVGALWVILQPVFMMVVFTLVFGRFAGLPSDGKPYALFTFSALLAWQLFANALTESSNSIVGNANLVTKVYCPRVLLPLASILAGLVDFAVSACILAILLAAYGVVPSVMLLALPALVLLAILTALSVGLWLAAINVKYRDVRFTIPFLVQAWLFATPVAYASSIVPTEWRLLYQLNPMVGVVDGFRWAFLGTPFPGQALLVSIAVVVPLLVGGAYYFRRTERYFADVI